MIIKRIKALIVLGAIFCTTVSFAPCTKADYSKKHSEAIDVMCGLFLSEQLDGTEYKPEDIITRGEFVYRMNVFDRGVGGEVPTKCQSTFLDVEIGNQYYSDIAYAQSLGVISNDAKFYPDKEITVTEAASMAIRRLGYGVNAEVNGGYPNGYNIVANQLKLLDGVDGDTLTRENSIQLLYNMSRTYSQKVTGWTKGEYNSVLSYDEKDTFLEETLGFIRATGIVSAIGNQSLNDTQYAENLICIGDNLLDVGFTKLGDILGQNVLYYYKEDFEITDNDSLLYAAPYKMEDHSLVINAKEIDGVSNGVVDYYVNNKKKYQTINEDIDIIYNGRPLRDNTEATLSKVVRGSFKFYDSNRDGKYEVLSVTSTHDYVVKQYNSYSNYVTFKNGNPIYCDDVQIKITLPTGSTAYDMSALKENDVLTVFISNDGSVITGEVSNKRIEGTVTAIKEEYVFIDNERYELSPDLDLNKIKLGMKSEFLLSINGELVSYLSDNVQGVFKLGVLNKIISNSDEETMHMEILTQSGERQSLELSYNVKIDGITVKNFQSVYKDYLSTGVVPSSICGLCGDGVRVYRNLIRYKQNGDGVINVIDTSFYNENYEDYDDTLILLYSGYKSVPDENGYDVKEEIVADKTLGISSGSQKYSKSMKKFYGSEDVYITDDTSVFYASSDLTKAQSNDYRYYTGGAGFSNGGAYWISSYKENADDMCASAVVRYYSTSESGDISPDITPVIITDIISSVNEDDEVVSEIEFTGLNGKKTQTQKMLCRSNEVYENVKPMVSKLDETEAAKESYKIEKGDMVRLQYNDKLEIEKIELIYRGSTDNMVCPNPLGQTTNSYGTTGKSDYFRLIEGYVMKTKNDFVLISFAKPWMENGQVTSNNYELHRVNVPVLIYNTSNHKGNPVRIGSIADLLPYEEFGEDMSKVFLYTRYGEPKLLYVYAEE